jgi:hypothetical protein
MRAAWLLAGLVCGTTAGAQAHPEAPTLLLVGQVVTSDTSKPAPYSSVELLEIHARHLADEQGRFSFRVPPGSYHLRVRQLGFAAHDTVLVLGAEPALQRIRIAITRVPVQLGEVRVVRPQKCVNPGVDSVDEPALYAIIAAVRENAYRELLLRRSYPFEYTMEDVQTSAPTSTTAPSSSEIRSVDTLAYRSDEMTRYHPGATVFTDVTDPAGAWERMRLPSLVDFVDSAFVATHCFDYDVTDAGDYEIGFRPLESLAAPDVAGTVSLDTATFVVRGARVELTRPEEVMPGYVRLEVVTTYREMVPRVALPATIASTQTYHSPGPQSVPFVATEVQSIRRLRFLKGVPAGVAREQHFAPPVSVATPAMN